MIKINIIENGGEIMCKNKRYSLEENFEQIIYINMDDSGRLVHGEPSELVFVYGGVFFSFFTRARGLFKTV